MGLSRMGAIVSAVLTGTLIDRIGVASTIYFNSGVFLFTAALSMRLKETKVHTKGE